MKDFNECLNQRRLNSITQEELMEEVSRIINAQEVSISKSDIEEAFERTEASLDSDNYEHRYSPWHFIDIDGAKKPINDVFWNIPEVQDAASSKDDIHSIQKVFTKLGFELYDRKEHAEDILRDTFEEILYDYPTRQGNASKDKRLYQLLVNKAPNFVNHITNRNFDEKTFEFKGTAGQGNWPNIPWVAALHPKETDTTQKGVYVVYLFDPEKEVVYATLNQGTKKLIDKNGKRETREILEDRAGEIREKVNLKSFSGENPDLSDNDKLYEESTIYQKKYELEDLPDSGQIRDDFVNLAEAYLDYVEIKDKLEYPNIDEKSSERRIEDFESEKIDEDSASYFWVTADPSIWEVSELESGDKKFYPGYLPSGNKARIFSNFEKASKGDRVVFYQSTPVKKVVAEGVVDEGLHEEEAEGYDDPVEGVTLEYNREIEGDISWSQLKEIPDLEGSKPIINTSQGSIFKLEREEFETILSLETPRNEKRTPDIEVDKGLSADLEIKFDDLYFPEDEEESIKNQIEASLNSGKHIIFTGLYGFHPD
ncbi:hypothetical protein HRED_02106 [Candidatus Haloredivivus sp. G17]|nr:hypothetical protein HRED_02106 [Candidatus Haloredivivus sp. G17]